MRCVLLAGSMGARGEQQRKGWPEKTCYQRMVKTPSEDLPIVALSVVTQLTCSVLFLLLELLGYSAPAGLALRAVATCNLSKRCCRWLR